MRGLLIASLVWSCASAYGLAAEVAADPAKNLKLAKDETAIYVSNMHCKTCARKISSKLFAIKGVKQVRTNVKDNLAIVQTEPKKPLDPLAAWGAVQQAGFKPTKLIGPGGTYVPNENVEKKTPVKLAESPAKNAAAAR
ncbi:MAG: heavy-metal-associated domain-containing protein [Pirellulales bacterium]|nr:heavy-metal-associated domain-containing protein [Pirellulales bacterium]